MRKLSTRQVYHTTIEYEKSNFSQQASWIFVNQCMCHQQFIYVLHITQQLYTKKSNIVYICVHTICLYTYVLHITNQTQKNKLHIIYIHLHPHIHTFHTSNTIQYNMCIHTHTIITHMHTTYVHIYLHTNITSMNIYIHTLHPFIHVY